jgi:hypothetical protein
MRGQNARSGPGVRPGFEGGQTPQYRRYPKLKGIAGGESSNIPSCKSENQHRPCFVLEDESEGARGVGKDALCWGAAHLTLTAELARPAFVAADEGARVAVCWGRCQGAQRQTFSGDGGR